MKPIIGVLHLWDVKKESMWMLPDESSLLPTANI